ncbi:MAG: PspC domain-containing protein [Mariniphaga sp.]|nr:PspC domain-containing protein [Mariniphaga sp.]MDD4425603.1 PspC domain-containing protein [Mariniphaga sp.]
MEKISQPKKLYRSRDSIIGGVLSGFADYIFADKTLVRLVFALVSILSAGFPGLLVYIIAWIVIPVKPQES